jgi:hypothetical protein
MRGTYHGLGPAVLMLTEPKELDFGALMTSHGPQAFTHGNFLKPHLRIIVPNTNPRIRITLPYRITKSRINRRSMDRPDWLTVSPDSIGSPCRWCGKSSLKTNQWLPVSRQNRHTPPGFAVYTAQHSRHTSKYERICSAQ